MSDVKLYCWDASEELVDCYSWEGAIAAAASLEDAKEVLWREIEAWYIDVYGPIRNEDEDWIRFSGDVRTALDEDPIIHEVPTALIFWDSA